MSDQIHTNARTTPTTLKEIQTSAHPQRMMGESSPKLVEILHGSGVHLQATLNRSSFVKSSTWVLRRLRFCSLRSAQSDPNLGSNSGKLLFHEH